MATQQAQLEAVISADISQYNQDLDSAVSKLEKTAGAFDKIGKNLTAKLTVPFTALAGVLVKTASDIAELQSKFDVVFGDLAGETEEWAETLGDAVNRSRFDIQAFSAELQDTFKPLGFATTEAQKLSKELVQLGIDVASFNNKADADVIRDFQSALVGNTETVRKYGIVITQNVLEQQALREGLNKTFNELTELEKVQLRYNIILASSTDALGDASRTSGSFANQLKGLQADLKDLAVEFGEVLLPIALDLVEGLRESIESFKDLDDGTKETIITFGAFLAAIGPLSLAISGLIKAFTLLQTATIAVNTALSVTNPALVAISATLAVGITAWNNYADKIERAEKNLEKVDELQRTGNFKAQEEAVSSLANTYGDLTDRAEKLGIQLQLQSDALGASSYVKSTRDLQEVAKELGITEKEVRALRGEVSAESVKFIQALQKEYTTIENFNDAVKAVNAGRKQQAIETAKLAQEQKILNDITAFYGEEIRNQNAELQQGISAQRQYQDSINQTAETFNYLSQQEALNAEQKQELLILEQVLTDALGANAVQIDKNTGRLVVNETALKNFNNEVVKAIALTRETITVNIETKIKQGAEQFLQVENEIKDLEKQLFNARSIQQAKFLEKQINQLKVYRDAVKKETEANLDFQKEQERKAADEIVKNLESTISKLNTAQKKRVKTAEEIEAERIRILREGINAELSIINFRYNTEEITQEQLLEELRGNLERYSDFYESNLQEELSLRQQIFSIEKQLQEENINNQIRLLDKANNEVLQSLKDRERILENNHKDNIRRIEDERDLSIKAIEDELDAQERLLNRGRLQDRIQEIDAVIERYQKSTTAEGQSRFRQLLQEREDIELKLRKDTAQQQVKIIEANAEAELNTQDKKYQAEKEAIEKQAELVESQYENIFNNLKGITDEATAQTQASIDIFKNQLIQGLNNVFVEAGKAVINDSIAINAQIIPQEKLSISQDKVNFGVPQGVAKGDIYNITNNINVNNTFNITSDENGVSAEELSEQIANLVSIEIKEVL